LKTSNRHSAKISRRAFTGRFAAGAAAFALTANRQAHSATPDRKLGVALVGLGKYSTDELGPALRETQHCRLAGVVTGSPEKGLAWVRQYGFPEQNIFSYNTIGRLAQAADIDIVYVVTPNFLHAAHVIAAAKAGKHVIAEKPFTTSVADAQAVIAACRVAKVKLSVGYRLHFDPYHGELMRLARDKDFGNFTRARGKLGFFMDRKTWRSDRALVGGLMMDIGIYIIQAACMTAGEVAPIAVTASEGPKTRPEFFTDIEEMITFTMEFANGLVFEGSASNQTYANQFRAEAPLGWIQLDRAFSYRGISGATSRSAMNSNPPVRQQTLQIDDFARCIFANRQSPVSGEMGLREMKIIAAIYEAIRTGKRVELKA